MIIDKMDWLKLSTEAGLPHPDRCEWCEACVRETDGVVSLCMDHKYLQIMYEAGKAKSA